MKFFFTFFLFFLIGFVQGQSNTNQTNLEKSSETEKGSAPIQNSAPTNLEEIQIQTLREDKIELKKIASDMDLRQSSKEQKDTEIQNQLQLFLVQNNQARTQVNSRSPSVFQQAQMESVLKYYETTAPNSFEFHFFTYLAGNYNVNLSNHLKAAERLKPDNEAVLVQLVSLSEILNQESETKFYLEKLKKTGKIKVETIAYARNLLASALDSGIVLTHGFDDEMGCRYVQLVEQKYTQVHVYSLDFMQSEYYRNRLLNSKFKLPTETVIDVAYLKDFCQVNPGKNLQLSMTFPKEYLKELSPRLQVLGLTFLYKSDPVSTFVENEMRWNSIFSVNFGQDALTTSAKELLKNYLPMLLYLRQTYSDNKIAEKVAEIDKAIDVIARKSGDYEKINTLRKNK